MKSSDSQSIYIGSYRIRKPFQWMGLLGATYIVLYASNALLGESLFPSTRDPLASYLFGAHALDFPFGWLYILSVALVGLYVIHRLSGRRA